MNSIIEGLKAKLKKPIYLIKSGTKVYKQDKYTDKISMAKLFPKENIFIWSREPYGKIVNPPGYWNEDTIDGIKYLFYHTGKYDKNLPEDCLIKFSDLEHITKEKFLESRKNQLIKQIEYTTQNYHFFDADATYSNMFPTEQVEAVEWICKELHQSCPDKPWFKHYLNKQVKESLNLYKIYKSLK